jgi:hypothetical protein
MLRNFEQKFYMGRISLDPHPKATVGDERKLLAPQADCSARDLKFVSGSAPLCKNQTLTSVAPEFLCAE